MTTPPVLAPARLTGLGHHFPGEPVPNSYFEKELSHLAIDDEWIRRHTGVGTRHWGDDQERPVEMGVRAAQDALVAAGLGPDDVDLVIGTSATTRPRVNPSSVGNRYMDISLPLQKQLGATRAACFDVGAVACAGFLYGSMVASSLLAMHHGQTALIVCAENPRPILNFDYRYSALFGAGAAAAVWQRCEPGEGGLLDVVVRSDGRHYDVFDIDDQDKVVMRGREVGRIGPAMLTGAAREVLGRTSRTVADIDWFIPHQGNVNMVHEVRDALGIPDERLLMNLEHRGNTHSVSIPGCLSEHVQAGTVRPGDTILALGIGRGFTWGAMLFRYR